MAPSPRSVLHYTARFCLRTGTQIDLECSSLPQSGFASFLLEEEFYICGGYNGGRKISLSKLLKMDEWGKCRTLAPMKEGRRFFSLSGASSLLFAVGGWNRAPHWICEHYQAKTDKWKQLPPLNESWTWPGSCLLQSKRAFCFSGGAKYQVETLEFKTN